MLEPEVDAQARSGCPTQNWMPNPEVDAPQEQGLNDRTVGTIVTTRRTKLHTAISALQERNVTACLIRNVRQERKQSERLIRNLQDGHETSRDSIYISTLDSIAR